MSDHDLIRRGDALKVLRWEYSRQDRADITAIPAADPLADPRVKALVEALEAWVELTEHCSIEDGVCCCGDNMEGHNSPMNCGHSPVDHGAYIAGQLRESTLAALATFKGGEA